MPSGSRSCCLSFVAASLILAGCGAQQRVVPWREGLPLELGPPPPRNVPPLPRGTSPCRPSQLRLWFAWGPPFHGGLDEGVLTARNVGVTSCAIGGLPSVGLAARSGSLRVGGPTWEPAADWWRPPGYPPSDPLWGLRPGVVARAAVLLEWACVTPTGDAIETTIRIGFGSARFAVRMTACLHSFSRLDRGPFTPPPRPEPPPVRFPLRAAILGRPAVREGERLRFLVRLTNTSLRAFRFPYCPEVSFGIDGGDGAGGGTLNCHGLDAIGPRQGVVVEMRSHRPVRFFRPGPHRLLWWFTDTPALASSVKAGAAVMIST